MHIHLYLFRVKNSYFTCVWTDCKLQLDSVTISVICLSLSLSIHSFSITHTFSCILLFSTICSFSLSKSIFSSHLLWLLAGREKVKLITTATRVLHNEHTHTHTRTHPHQYFPHSFSISQALFFSFVFIQKVTLSLSVHLSRPSVPTHCFISSLSLSDKSPQAPSALLKDHMLLRGWADPNQTVTFWHTPFLLLLSIDIGLACYSMIFIGQFMFGEVLCINAL